MIERIKSKDKIAELKAVGCTRPLRNCVFPLSDRRSGFAGCVLWGLAISRQIKHLWLIILAQAVCVAVGLWMQHQYVRTSVLRAAEQRARTGLAALAEQLASEFGPETLKALKLLDTDTAELELERVRQALRTHEISGGGAIIIDREWRVIAHGEDGAHAAGPSLEAGRRIPWEPTKGPSQDPAAPLEGNLTLPDGAYLAAASALDGYPAYIVVYRSAADVSVATSALVRSLPSLSCMTFLWMCALLSLIVFLVLGRFHDDTERERKLAAANTLRHSQDLVRTRDSVIFGLAKLADSRDPETGDHLERMSIYSTMLATALQRHPKFADVVTPAFTRVIGISTALHDIGKVGIEDSILLKPGKLSPEQTARMRQHATIGGECLREIELRLGSSNFLQMAREIAFAHHERWDGTGYPNGIAEDAIPLPARIAAIADVYDALSNKRVYKDALPHNECVAIIRSESGKGFDPDLVEVWLRIEHRFREVALQYASDSADENEINTAEHIDEPDRDAGQDALVPQAVAGER